MSPDWSAKEDPVPYASLDDPQSLNLYSYVRNNPLARTDPDGHCCESDFNSFENHSSEHPLNSDERMSLAKPFKDFAAAHPQLMSDMKALAIGILTKGMGGETISEEAPIKVGEPAGSSPKVDNIIKTIDEGGFKVTPNDKTAGQESNVTITHPSEPGTKLNLRTETHPLPESGGQPARHVNVEKVTPRTATTPKKIDNTHITQ